jgi:hypothetical protein
MFYSKLHLKIQINNLTTYFGHKEDALTFSDSKTDNHLNQI